MRWYYLSHFTRYKMALDKIPLFIVDKHDALGADPSSQKGIPMGIDLQRLGKLILARCALERVKDSSACP